MPDISWKARKTPFASDLNSSRGHLNGYGSRQNSKSSRYQLESERTSSSKIVRHRLLLFGFLLSPGCIPWCNQKFQVQVRKTHLSRIHAFGISWMPPPSTSIISSSPSTLSAPEGYPGHWDDIIHWPASLSYHCSDCSLKGAQNSCTNLTFPYMSIHFSINSPYFCLPT